MIRNGEAIEATADELSRQPHHTGRYATEERIVFIISFQQKFSKTLHEQKPCASSFFIQLDRLWKALTGESVVNYYQFRHRRLFIIDPDTRATHVERIVIYDAIVC